MSRVQDGEPVDHLGMVHRGRPGDASAPVVTDQQRGLRTEFSDEATDVVGYIPYVARITPRDGLTLHASDNRVELDRANHALDMAAAGRRVVVVSSGDPGVFAMAAAVFEALEARPDPGAFHAPSDKKRQM